MAEQLILDLAQPEPPTFANFVAGANREAIAAVRGVAERSSAESGVLIWGARGVGKSHLLRAAATVAAPGRPVIECPRTAEIQSAPDVPVGALLIVDDVDVADPATQGRLFTLLNGLAASGGQWIAAAEVPPARLPLRDDLRTRLALGLVLELVPLADADKPQALIAYARERGFRLADDVIDYLLAHGRRDMPTLVATLAALDRHSLSSRRGITVPLLRQWLQRDFGFYR